MDESTPAYPKAHVYPVLLAGGTGTRLWPVSRQLYPKQLVKFIGNDSLIQNTVNRLKPISDLDNIRVVCGADHFHEISRHLTKIGLAAEGKIISEPCGRNTAPAVLLALHHVAASDPEAVVCIFPADHVILDVEQFQKDVKAAVALAEDGYIVTFGIKPLYPETGYGYIEGGEAIQPQGMKVKRFVEKPDREKAEDYLAAGNFFWNSGMFTFKLATMMAEFKTYSSELAVMMEKMMQKRLVPELGDYMALPDISVDFAIMEHTEKAAVLPSAFGWSDIGSWKSLFDFMPKDHDNNVIVGDVVTKETQNCFIMGQDRLIATNRVKDLVVVDTPDSVFISDMETSRDVKEIVSVLKQTNRKEFYQHLTVYHEWGKNTVLQEDTMVKVHQMTLFPQRAYCSSKSDFVAHQFTVTAGEIVLEKDTSKKPFKRGQTFAVDPNTGYTVRNSLDVPAQLVSIEFSNGV